MNLRLCFAARWCWQPGCPKEGHAAHLGQKSASQSTPGRDGVGLKCSICTLGPVLVALRPKHNLSTTACSGTVQLQLSAAGTGNLRARPGYSDCCTWCSTPPARSLRDGRMLHMSTLSEPRCGRDDPPPSKRYGHHPQSTNPHQPTHSPKLTFTPPQLAPSEAAQERAGVRRVAAALQSPLGPAAAARAPQPVLARAPTASRRKTGSMAGTGRSRQEMLDDLTVRGVQAAQPAVQGCTRHFPRQRPGWAALALHGRTCCTRRPCVTGIGSQVRPDAAPGVQRVHGAAEDPAGCVPA